MTPRRMGRLQYGLSGQLDLAREGRLPNGRAAGEGAAALCGALCAIDPSAA
jgi:hypothetical protein